ncbi:MAG: sigma-70 family RNA polymerase sigma factor [Planctomycetes bacterium]|nr:sigma-70 family RNA polymerase sigma factor [Planctomycetota bacterium]
MDERSASDEDLMLRLQRRRDEDAFGALFARYRVPITSYLFRLVGNRTEAESLAQEAFLRVLEKADHYEHPKRFSTWFYTIARNLATDFLKKKRAVVPDDFHGLTESLLAPGDPEPEERSAWQEDLRRLAEALYELPLPYREVVVLRALQELSYREIAAIVGCPESTARSRMDYGLDFLRKRYRRRQREKSAPGADETRS